MWRAEGACGGPADGRREPCVDVESVDYGDGSWCLVEGAEAAPAVPGQADTAPATPAPPTGDGAISELDLCFACDCTGSMGSYIQSAQQNICRIVERIEQSQGATVRFGLICYRDHPPEDKSYVTRAFPFTSDAEQMRTYVGTMRAAGGGDGPEAVTAALHDALHMPWRPNATRVVVLIADAPPHGIEPSGDGFPNGDPDGRDPLEIARSMAANGIACYSVGCEPTLGQYMLARDFMCTLAEITGGQAVALSSAALLADVIVNGSAEEISLTRLQREVKEEVRQVRASAAATGEALDEEECSRRVCRSLQERGAQSVHMKTDGGMVRRTSASSWNTQLSAAKAAFCTPAVEAAASHGLPASAASPVTLARPRRSRAVGCRSAPAVYEACIGAEPPMPSQTISTLNVQESALISQCQVQRLMKRSHA